MNKEELKQKITDLARPDRVTANYLIEAELDDIVNLVLKEVEKTERAYGGCRDCFGKGYATTIDFIHGIDTDWDIGGQGTVIHDQNPIIRYCKCDRGKQLQQLTYRED